MFSKILGSLDKLLYFFIKDSSSVIEWLSISENIEKLAKEQLTPDLFDQAGIIARYIVTGGLQRGYAIGHLCRYVGYKPKRPLMYLSTDHIRSLPNNTRDVVRYCGDYLDVIVKCIAKDNAPKLFFTPKSLTGNVRFLEKKLSNDLLDVLRKYDEYLYLPAKHDFNSMEKKHKFTVKEAVYAIYLTMEISKGLVTLSPLAKEYLADTNPNIWGQMAFSKDRYNV